MQNSLIWYEFSGKAYLGYHAQEPQAYIQKPKE